MELHERVELIRAAVEGFNAGDIDAVVRLLHPTVEWPDLMDDKLIWGPEAVRDYWERQFAVMTPHLVTVETHDAGEDLVVVNEQRVLDRETGGDLLPMSLTVQRFGFRDGRIARMTMHASVEAALEPLDP